MNFDQKIMKIRQQSGGQIYTGLKKQLKTTQDLSTFYTPGIAEPCRHIAKDKNLARELTIKKNTVAVISDGSAILGLGNLGAQAALPVMEGKCMLFKQFADVDAFPLVLDTQDPKEIIATIKNIAPGFGGINLEDIAAPKCFQIEEQLIKELDIPVFHDDQHGTAICVLAGLINALKLVNKDKAKVRVVFSGAGAAGIAIARLFREYGIKHLEMVDSQGIVYCSRQDLICPKCEFCSDREGTLANALQKADVFIGVSKPDLLRPELIKQMNDQPIIFALANPIPEIMPDKAKKAGAAIIATGRSDYPNQINNVLVFPGLFRGLLDAQITKVTIPMKLAAAQALADYLSKPTFDKILPNVFDQSVAQAVAKAVSQFKS